MSFRDSIGIRHKIGALTLSFAVVFSTVILMSGFSLMGARKSQLRLEKEKLPQLQQMSDFTEIAGNTEITLMAHILSQSSGEMKELEAKAVEQETKASAILESLRTQATDEKAKTLSSLIAAAQNLSAANKKALAFSRDEKKQEATVAHDSEVVPAFQALQHQLSEMGADVQNSVRSVGAESIQSMQKALILLFMGLAVSLILGVVISVFTIHALTQPLRQMVAIANSGSLSSRFRLAGKDELTALGEAFNGLLARLQKKTEEASAIAAGTLTQKIEVVSDQDELGKSFATMQMGLRNLITNVACSGQVVNTRASELRSAAEQLSEGAITQASAIEQMSASLNELQSNASEAANVARHSLSLAQNASSATERGNLQVQESVRSMDQIVNVTQKISDITQTIDTLAFQINLLALNAAVEAAHAGSLGKGFAVVANEVKSLAERSAHAAHETTELLETVNTSVRYGVEVAQKTEAVFRNITRQTNEIVSDLGLLSKANENQAAGITQISIGIQQIENVARSDSHTSEENSAAASALQEESNKLHSILNKFRC